MSSSEAYLQDASENGAAFHAGPTGAGTSDKPDWSFSEWWLWSVSGAAGRTVGGVTDPKEEQ